LEHAEALSKAYVASRGTGVEMRGSIITFLVKFTTQNDLY